MEGFPGNMQQLLSQAKEMQEKFSKMQEEVKNKTVEASAGGGMVKVTVNGKQEVVAMSIDPVVVNPDDIKMLEDLVRAAVNEGIRKSHDLVKQEMAKLTGGISIPGLFG
ncbi:YbaB/EbfC family nucleoid-associated protein [bacterium J17]|nr:YbaB/EbfC family nucleoid-associated protein [bacterium J17]